MDLKYLFQILTGKGKPNIRAKILKLLLSSTFWTFAILGLFSLAGMLITWNIVYNRGDNLSRTTSEYTRNFVDNNEKNNLLEISTIKAQQINNELDENSCDVLYIARELERILSAPQNYPSTSLPNLMETDVYSGQAYIFYSPSLRENITPEIAEEIAIVSNIGGLMETISNVGYKGYLSEIFFGSKHGYTISVDSLESEKTTVYFGGAFTESYDPRIRPWYIEATQKDRSIFTDVYLGTSGYRVTCAAPYHYSNGDIAGVVGIGTPLETLDNLYMNSKSKENTLEFILNDKAQIIMVSHDENLLSAGMNDVSKSDEPSIVALAKRMTAGESGVEIVSIDNEEYYVAFSPIETTGWSFGMLVKKEFVLAPAEEISRSVISQMDDFKENLRGTFLIMPFILILILAALLYVLTRRGINVSDKFAKPISELTDGVRELSSGHFDKKLSIKTGDEIEHLAVCFNAMTDELQSYIKNLQTVTAERERLAAELDVAAKIQMSMLPQKFPARDDCEIFATMHPAKYVGGDFYDFYFLDEKHLVITIADVSGKGVPAAMFMAMSKTILKNYALMMQNPDDFSAVMACTNRQLCQGNDEKMFVTVFLGMLNLETSEFVFVNGGHNFPLVYHGATNNFEYLDVKKSCLLGIKKTVRFTQQSLQLSHGDILFLYTDGVTEAMNEDDEEYLPERLRQTLNSADKQAPLKDLLDFVLADVKKHAGNAEQSDDITMLAVRI